MMVALEFDSNPSSCHGLLCFAALPNGNWAVQDLTRAVGLAAQPAGMALASPGRSTGERRPAPSTGRIELICGPMFSGKVQVLSCSALQQQADT